MKDQSWSVAIFTSRETPELLAAAITAAEIACAGVPSTIDVIVNGNRALADAITATIGHSASSTLRIWFIALADKSHAWNQYVETIAPACDVSFFIDGYARLAADSLRLIARTLAENSEAWAASGVPTVGRSAKHLRGRMQSEGGIHGNLYALRGSTLALLKAKGFRFPLGMYRNDPLLGAVVCFSGDPGAHRWNAKRLAVVPAATWTNDTLRLTRWSSIVTQWKRVQRQAQGVLENAAVRQHLALDRLLPETLPRTAAELVARWRAAHPDEARALLRHPLRRRAARELALRRDWSLAKRAPELLRERKGGLR